MNIHYIVLIFSIVFSGQVHANSCLAINEIISESNMKLDHYKLSDKEYVKELLQIAAKTDQNIRSSDYSQCENLSSAMNKIDANNTSTLKKIIKAHAWFPISIFGKTAVSDAWVIVQHSQDLNLQHKVLFIMSQLLASNEADRQQFALLYDRVALNYLALGIKQRYGTQYVIEGDTVAMQPCEGDASQINTIRKTFKLQPSYEYEEILKSIFLTNLKQVSK